VISENSIISVQDCGVTFNYTDSKTGKTQYRTLKGEEFCWLVFNTFCPMNFAGSETSAFYTATLKHATPRSVGIAGYGKKSLSHASSPNLNAHIVSRR
jgi:hypothetical protein